MNSEGYKPHISGQFNAELEGIKSHMLEMGGLVEQQVRRGVESLINPEVVDAEAIVARDDEVNEMEVAVDAECSRILALRQPAASDLRLVLTIIKLIPDLERIGDEAAKIAKQSIKMTGREGSPTGFSEMRGIGDSVADMLRDALDAFARMDVDLAISVVESDDKVDRDYGAAMNSLVRYMTEDPDTVEVVINEVWALRSLERIGDHARNIAEHVIYLATGINARHLSLQDLLERLDSEA